MNDPAISISSVRLGNEEEDLVLEVLRSGHLAQGPVVAELEDAFAELCGVSHAIAVNSGTTALIASLTALGVGPGDEVITSPFTFAATLNAILALGATARFADIDDTTFAIDPDSVEEVVNDRTRVVMPVHLYGLPASVDVLTQIAARAGARLVEDAAQAHGATIVGRSVGSFDVGCFSLYATKNITTGEGGVVTTDDPEIADRLRLLRNQGMRARYQYEAVGNNWRLTDLQAAVGVPQLRRIDVLTQTRVANAARLAAGLAGIPGIVVPTTPSDRTHVFHQFTIRVLPEAGISRGDLADGLRERGIGTGVYYPRLCHNHPCYRSLPNVSVDPTPTAARVATEVLSLPVHAHLADGDVEQIADAVRQIIGG